MVDQVEKKDEAAEAAPARRTIVVAHPFVLTNEKGERRHFAAGIHEDVEAEIADHWYVKPHLSKDGKVPFSGGAGAANDDAERRRLMSRIEEQDAALQAAREAADRVALEQTALKARAEGAEAGVGDAQGQISALRKRVSELEADNAALQVRVEAAERAAAAPSAEGGTEAAPKNAGKGGRGA